MRTQNYNYLNNEAYLPEKTEKKSKELSGSIAFVVLLGVVIFLGMFL